MPYLGRDIGWSRSGHILSYGIIRRKIKIKITAFSEKRNSGEMHPIDRYFLCRFPFLCGAVDSPSGFDPRGTLASGANLLMMRS